MFIAPMLLNLREKPFSDQAYIFEPKIDGHRLILSNSGEENRLFTDIIMNALHNIPSFGMYQLPVMLF
jgi:hypothetical protein